MSTDEFTVINVLNGLNSLYASSDKAEKERASHLLERFQKSVSISPDLSDPTTKTTNGNEKDRHPNPPNAFNSIQSQLPSEV
jgi:hypothetical protein